MNLIAFGFVLTMVCVCFLSFAYYYVFRWDYSIMKNGQMRSLSGIMKSDELKPYFSFVMGCLGGSLFLACGLQGSDLMLGLSLGMYVSMIGLLCYDVKFNRSVHYSFVFMLITLGCVFSGFLLQDNTQIWCYAAAVAYDTIVSLFLLCFFMNLRLLRMGGEAYHTMQALLEILWVLCLVMLMCVYAFQG